MCAAAVGAHPYSMVTSAIADRLSHFSASEKLSVTQCRVFQTSSPDLSANGGSKGVLELIGKLPRAIETQTVCSTENSRGDE